jgi:hypothetical protein
MLELAFMISLHVLKCSSMYYKQNILFVIVTQYLRDAF